MKQVSKSAIAIATFACATIVSLSWSEQGGVSLSVQSAQARVGRPLTPMSVAGVSRRHYRRAAYGYGGYGYAAGAAALGAAAAVGTAAAVASSPYYGYGSNTWDSSYAAQDDPYYGKPHYAPRAYYGHGPYYGFASWEDYSARNGIKCAPGSTTTLDDGHTYICQ
jgi:hypothetical protein